MTTHPAPDALRLVPVSLIADTMNWMARAYERIHGLPRISDTDLADKVGAAKERLRPYLDAPAVQPAAGREEVPEGVMTLTDDLTDKADELDAMDARGQIWGLEEVPALLRRAAAAISTPAQASGEPVAWQSRIYDYKGEAGAWHPCDPPEDPTNLRPCRIIEYRPLYAHPPAQASETGGEIERLRGALKHGIKQADWIAGFSASTPSEKEVARIISAPLRAALSAPQAPPGEGEQS